MVDQVTGMSPEEEVAPGESEHDKAMIAAYDKAQETGDYTPPKETQSKDERHEWLPENFNSGEDLVKSYNELRRKLTELTQGKPEGTEEKPEGTEEKPEGTEEKPEDKPTGNEALSEEALAKYSQEIATKGELSEESMKILKDANIPDHIIQSRVDETKAQIATAQEKNANEIFEIAGGSEDSYSKVIEWAKDNIDEELATAYDSALTSGNVPVAKQLLGKIVDAHKNAVGYEGDRVNGSPNKSEGDVYRSWNQVTKDMSDPRYSGGMDADPAFVETVQEKVRRSMKYLD